VLVIASGQFTSAIEKTRLFYGALEMFLASAGKDGTYMPALKRQVEFTRMGNLAV
jgi:hypothetical protein